MVMTPAEYCKALRRVADDAWPGAGIEVTVQVWRPDGDCSRCRVGLERPLHHEIGALGVPYRRVFELPNGKPVRTPHPDWECQRLHFAEDL